MTRASLPLQEDAATRLARLDKALAVIGHEGVRSAVDTLGTRAPPVLVLRAQAALLRYERSLKGGAPAASASRPATRAWA